jgi:hypothetical protein
LLSKSQREVKTMAKTFDFNGIYQLLRPPVTEKLNPTSSCCPQRTLKLHGRVTSALAVCLVSLSIAISQEADLKGNWCREGSGVGSNAVVSLRQMQIDGLYPPVNHRSEGEQGGVLVELELRPWARHAGKSYQKHGKPFGLCVPSPTDESMPPSLQDLAKQLVDEKLLEEGIPGVCKLQSG